MNMHDWKNAIINSPVRTAMPIMTYPGLQLVGRSVLDMVRSGEVQFQCIRALSNRYPTIASATLIMDLSLEAEAFGSRITYSEHEIPTVGARLIPSFDEIGSLEVPMLGKGRTMENLRAASLAVQHINDRPVFGGIIGPFSLAGRLFDISEMMMAILVNPEASHSLLNTCTAFLVNYAMAFKKAGAQGVVIAEPAAGLLAPAECDEFSSRYVKMIKDELQDENFIVILHNCGNTQNLVDSMVSTGCMGFHFGNAVEMTAILQQVPPDRLVFGNLDPAGIIRNGNPECIRSKTTELLEKTRPFRNFILSSGCDIPPGTPLENIDALFDALTAFNKR